MHSPRGNLVRFVPRIDDIPDVAVWAVGVCANGVAQFGHQLPPGTRVGHIAKFATPGTCFYYPEYDYVPNHNFGYIVKEPRGMTEMLERHRRRAETAHR